ncbi:hypothetical protein [Sutcliffiella halmapala]|uniref:hypothetical protein n=1 Tax=Sutcliffiella halmapala TaxID=79882 RepID=UPI000995C4E9|nr:hypothetical protein [Sutcliffiella halmapala]
MTDSPKIPKLELGKFTFSPPGPMGWNMAEYEQLLENPDQLVLNESTVNSQLQSLRGIQLVELSLSGELKAKHLENKEEAQLAEVDLEETLEVISVEPELAESVVEVEEFIEEEMEEVLEEEPVPKRKVTIIIKETALKKPWIAPDISPSKKNH